MKNIIDKKENVIKFRSISWRCEMEESLVYRTQPKQLFEKLRGGNGYMHVVVSSWIIKIIYYWTPTLIQKSLSI